MVERSEGDRESEEVPPTAEEAVVEKSTTEQEPTGAEEETPAVVEVHVTAEEEIPAVVGEQLAAAEIPVDEERDRFGGSESLPVSSSSQSLSHNHWI